MAIAPMRNQNIAVNEVRGFDSLPRLKPVVPNVNFVKSASQNDCGSPPVEVYAHAPFRTIV